MNTSEDSADQPNAPGPGPNRDGERPHLHPHPEGNRPRHSTANIVVRELPWDKIPEEKTTSENAAGRSEPAAIMPGEPPRMLAAMISRLMRRRSLPQYLEFTAAALALAAIAFLLLPKNWVSGEEPDLESIPAQAPMEPENRFMAADASAWVDGVPIGAVRATRILIDGKIHDLGAPIPPFGQRWIGRDEQDNLVFEGPDGVVRKRDMSR